MTDTTSKSTGRVPTFDGNAANFLMFAKTFRAHANANGWKKALDGETELPESEAGMLAATGAALEAVKRNNSAAAAITLAMNSNTSMFPILAAGETRPRTRTESRT